MHAASRESSVVAVGRITLNQDKVGGTGTRPVPSEMKIEKGV
jgi:hypothetical protein